MVEIAQKRKHGIVKRLVFKAVRKSDIYNYMLPNNNNIIIARST